MAEGGDHFLGKCLEIGVMEHDIPKVRTFEYILHWSVLLVQAFLLSSFWRKLGINSSI